MIKNCQCFSPYWHAPHLNSARSGAYSYDEVEIPLGNWQYVPAARICRRICRHFCGDWQKINKDRVFLNEN